MPTHKSFCAVCGAVNTPLYQGLCVSCYAKEHPFIPEKHHPKVVICRRCHSYQDGHRWIQVGYPKQTLEEIITRAAYTAMAKSYASNANIDLEISLSLPDDLKERLDKSKDFDVEGILIVEGKPVPVFPEVRETMQFRLEIHPTICPICKNKHRGYFEAVLQIRSGKRRLTEQDLEDVLQIVYAQIDHIPHSYVSAVKEVKGGIDINISSKKAARQIAHVIAKRMYASQTMSSKVVSIKDGHAVTRLVIALTFPEVRVGDYIHAPRGLIRITRITNKGAYGIHQQTGASLFIKQPSQYPIVQPHDLKEDWLLLSKSRDSAQLMHLTSYKLLEVPLSPRLASIPDGSKIGIIILDGRAYLLDTEPVSQVK
ncbi:MAG: NMD3-related protein [Candidatus Ranarchaeia archaeon]